MLSHPAATFRGSADARPRIRIRLRPRRQGPTRDVGRELRDMGSFSERAGSMNHKVRMFRSQQGDSVAVVWSQGTAVYVVGGRDTSRPLLRLLLGWELRDGELAHLLETLPGTEILAGLLAEALGLEGEKAKVRRDRSGGDSPWASWPMSPEPARARHDRRARAGQRSWTRDQ